jgi:large subunit ribosomal protein L15
MPLVRRLPKRGFSNIFRKEFAVVNLDRLKEFAEGRRSRPRRCSRRASSRRPSTA